jgi:glycosyltransferase involved in cell wall biosynthesis
MRLFLITDAWSPQVNGVVRSLEFTMAELERRGWTVEVAHPGEYRSFPMPSYPEIRLAAVRPSALRARIARCQPDAIHIATEGPLGWAARRAAMTMGLPFTTSYHTRFPEYLRARAPVPTRLSYAWFRRFHAPAAAVMVSTPTLRDELASHGFRHLVLWPKGVDTALFRPDAGGGALHPDLAALPRPFFVTVARVAVEKNLDAFLGLDLPGTKIVIGDGPMRDELAARHPATRFLGVRVGEELACLLAQSDVFVFPSLTDTYGMVLLEAAACGLPSAAFPVAGPRDVMGASGPAVLDEDLGKAALAALAIPRQQARAFALEHSWEKATDAFATAALTRPVRPEARRPAS